MQVPLEIVARHVEVSAALRNAIRQLVTKLERFEDRLASCRVVVTRTPGRHRTGFRHQVRLDVRLPGREFMVSRTSGETLTTAVQAAFDAAARRLKDGVRRRNERGRRPRAKPDRARVVRVYPTAGYGFLETDDGRDVYFDARSVLDDGFDRLEPGMEVRYKEEQGREGPQASTARHPLRVR
ncbi:MAG: HPF/RaiA family ribosome-associated protein [Gemmatimonadales bacterium]